MKDVEEILQHYGVKGMKWGVSKARKAGSAVKTRVKEELTSRKRERGWAKTISKMDSMDTKEINRTFQRILMENDMKRISKKMNSQDRKDYRNRGKLSDNELQEKVNRLRAKDNLRRQISEATSSHRSVGKKLVSTVAGLSSKTAPYANVGKQIIDHAYGAYK